MNTRKELKRMITDANERYRFIFDEASMVNIKIDDLRRSESFVYVEEFTQGVYDYSDPYFNTKTTRIEIYFCKFVEYQADADTREDLRDLIETEIVAPFLKIFKKSKFAQGTTRIAYGKPPSRFDGNEVSIKLLFDLKEYLSC